MVSLRTAVAVLCVSLLGAAAPAGAQLLDELPIASGLNTPVFAFAPPGDQRLFILELAGRVRVLKGGEILPTDFLDITNVVDTDGEGGLLGIAFPPDFPANSVVYLYYTRDSNGRSRISRFDVTGDIAVENSEEIILEINQPYDNHNGGTIAFGADGFLYFGPGDGGLGNDPDERSQDPTDLLGKMLRIDVAVPPHPDSTPVAGENYAIPDGNPFDSPVDGIRDEIWAFGLRNPYRFSFDRLTGDMWIADVGQDALEEINFEPAGDPGGRNWGWDVMEGDACNGVDPAPAPPCNDPSLSLPFYQYAHVGNNCSGSVTGGFAYRGPTIPEIDGHYFFGDFCRGDIWSLDPVTGVATDRTAELDAAGGNAFGLLGFGEDGQGRVLVVLGSGDIYRIVKRTECADGISNDSDGLIDHPADPGCATPNSLTESPACDDGVDNDFDGKIDLADPTCAGDASRLREGSKCGSGAAAALIWVPLLVAARKRLFPLP